MYRLDKVLYTRYCQLCGYIGLKGIMGKLEPYCYLETPFVHLFLRIISKWNFPVSPLALIHVGQAVHVYSVLQFEDCPLYTLECHLSEVKVVEKGVELKLSCSAFSQPSRQLVWEAITTLLSRNQSTRMRSRRKLTNIVKQDELAEQDDMELTSND